MVTPVESKIRLDQYARPQDLLDDIVKLKEQYTSETKAIDYKLKEVILLQECERVTTKGLETMWRKLRDESNLTKR